MKKKNYNKWCEVDGCMDVTLFTILEIIYKNYYGRAL